MMGFTCSINNYRADWTDVPYPGVPGFAFRSRLPRLFYVAFPSRSKEAVTCQTCLAAAQLTLTVGDLNAGIDYEHVALSNASQPG